MHWFDRLERRIGGLAIPNLILYVIAGRGITWILNRANPGSMQLLELDPYEIANGQYWRLITFLILPWSSGLFWMLVNFYFSYTIGTALEAVWGAFRFNCYFFLGVAGSVLAAFVFLWAPEDYEALQHAHMLGVVNNNLDMTLLLAYCTLFPDRQVSLYFILSVRMKWIGWLCAGVLAVQFVLDPAAAKLGMVFALGNYLLFFRHHVTNRWRKPSVGPTCSPSPSGIVHRCVECGKTERTDPELEFRWCMCPKCRPDGREFCRPHLDAHVR